MSGPTALPMTCNEAQDALGAYALGALDPEEHRGIAQHLATCLECRQRLAVYDAVTEALGSAPDPVAPPAALRQRLLHTIQATADPARREQWLPSWWHSWLVLACWQRV
jgi:anti-sigma factor RsiW